jgi:hypothetical protein
MDLLPGCTLGLVSPIEEGWLLGLGWRRLLWALLRLQHGYIYKVKINEIKTSTSLINLESIEEIPALTVHTGPPDLEPAIDRHNLDSKNLERALSAEVFLLGLEAHVEDRQHALIVHEIADHSV